MIVCKRGELSVKTHAFFNKTSHFCVVVELWDAEDVSPRCLRRFRFRIDGSLFIGNEMDIEVNNQMIGLAFFLS